MTGWQVVHAVALGMIFAFLASVAVELVRDAWTTCRRGPS